MMRVLLREFCALIALILFAYAVLFWGDISAIEIQNWGAVCCQ